jgi:hypothetical protein
MINLDPLLYQPFCTFHRFGSFAGFQFFCTIITIHWGWYFNLIPMVSTLRWVWLTLGPTYDGHGFELLFSSPFKPRFIKWQCSLSCWLQVRTCLTLASVDGVEVEKACHDKPVFLVSQGDRLKGGGLPMWIQNRYQQPLLRSFSTQQTYMCTRHDDLKLSGVPMPQDPWNTSGSSLLRWFRCFCPSASGPTGIRREASLCSKKHLFRNYLYTRFYILYIIWLRYTTYLKALTPHHVLHFEIRQSRQARKCSATCYSDKSVPLCFIVTRETNGSVDEPFSSETTNARAF